ncbi:hypothetical protein ACJX0J_016465 [Zea mays]
MTYTIVFISDQYREVSIQFVLPFLLIVVIDIICNIVTIAYKCFFIYTGSYDTNVQSIEIPAFGACRLYLNFHFQTISFIFEQYHLPYDMSLDDQHLDITGFSELI